MRLQVVLYVAVVLCVASLAAGACTNGIQLNSNGQCVCPSGFSGVDCSTTPLGGCAASIAGATQADHFPLLDLVTASYDHNTLKLSVLGDYVTGRQYKAIKFVNQTAAECGLGSEGSWWSTDVVSCKDKFHVALPWANHTQCGFKITEHHEDSTDDLANEDNQAAIAEDHYVSYSAKFTLYYTESLGSIENITLYRNTSVPYEINIRFPTRLDVSLTNVNVTSIVEMGIALTQDNFDPETQQLTMEITIINAWPNMLDFVGDSWTIKTPNQVSHIEWSDGGSTRKGVTYVDDSTCTEDEGSVCVQSFQFTFNTSTCTFDDRYNFTLPLYTCRGNEYTLCTSDMFTLSFDLETSSVCQNITVTPPLAGNLKPFHTMDKDAYVNAGSVLPFSEPADTGFNIGSYGYFQVELVNTQDNTIALEFYEISFQANGLSNKNYLMKNGVIRNSNISLGNTDPDEAFHYDEAKLEVYNPAKGFQVYFSSVVFKVMPTKFTVYTFRASAYATFAGNEGETKKRTVDFVWEAQANQLSAWSNVNLAPTNGLSFQTKQTEVSDTTSLAYILAGAGAGLALIVMAVIGLAIYQKKQAASRLLENSI